MLDLECLLQADDVISALYAEHEKGNTNVGVDIETSLAGTKHDFFPHCMQFEASIAPVTVLLKGDTIN